MLYHSMEAGSATCDCETPDSCLCLAHITNREQGLDYSYPNQAKETEANFYLLDKGKGVNVDLFIKSKGCISGQDSECPSGLVYSKQKKTRITTENTESTVPYYSELHLPSEMTHRLPLHYIDEDTQLTAADAASLALTSVTKSTKYNIISAIGHILYTELKAIPHSTYYLHLLECQGILNQKKGGFLYTWIADIVARIMYLTRDSKFQAKIQVYPIFKWKVGVIIGTQEEIKRLSDDDRRALMAEYRQATSDQPQNKKKANQGRPHKGWKKKTERYDLINSLSLYGFAEYTEGENKTEVTTEKLVQEFHQYKTRSALLRNGESALKTAEKLFAGGDKYPIFSFELLPPQFKLVGCSELKPRDAYSPPRLEKSFELNCSPLTGFRFTIDLIQAFAARVGAQTLISAIREAGNAKEEAVKSGRNGAYFGAVFDMIVEGSCSGQQKLVTVLEFSQYNRSDSLGVRPPLY